MSLPPRHAFLVRVPVTRCSGSHMGSLANKGFDIGRLLALVDAIVLA